MPRALWLLVIGMAVNVTGSSFLWPLNTIYIHDHLGKSLSVAGIVLMLNSAASVFGNLIGGSLFDKIGGYKSILLGIGITLLALLGLTFWHNWPQYIIFLTIVGFGSGIVFPSMYAMAGSVWKEGGRKAFNAIYVAQNVGVAVGAALGGIVADYSFQLIFLANTLMYVIFLLIAVFGYRKIELNPGAQTSILQENSRIKNHQKMYALLILCVGYLLCWVAYVQWQTTIASFTQEINISLTQYSLLWTINGAIIVLGQPLMNGFLKRFSKSLKTQMIVGMLIFIGSFIVASKAHDFSGFMAGMIILTIGEMLIWPAVPTIASELAPKGREGFYQGVVNSTATGGRMIGPLLGGLLVDVYGMSMLFTVLISLFIVAIFTTTIYDRNLKRTAELKVNASI
ncbi:MULTISPECIES: MFS transporter [unclassified Bacillus (in: firmicutes)]|uniref:MDR family MFS transporter n=1 Tax=unclassified Bacillus (in: firmicutes) TaxID=185979 RepID=UPI0008F093A0|nr:MULTISPECIES: MFS transporter [unclassified Bacillus (in: firmicutes)]SFB18126.1 Predicted arabinose efflux permease, MFS family [Bacillus sp. UNCCL13]SFQ76344.1 Predicted arabinose efflux permease, MFS family [Bacillus sp. cl95]